MDGIPAPAENLAGLDLTMLEDYPHFFVFGDQRSGTTMLRMMLNSHPQIAVPQEAFFLAHYFTERNFSNRKPLSQHKKKLILRYFMGNLQFQRWNLPASSLQPINNLEITFKQLVGLLYWSYATLQGKKLCGDKTPSFIRKLEFLVNRYPQAHFIHIVRDGRDSYLSAAAKGWNKSKSILVGGLLWRIKMQTVKKSITRLPDRFFEVRYEDLVAEPEAKLSEICQHLGCSFDKSMLNFYENSENQVLRKHSTLIFKPVDPTNVAKWKKTLSLADLQKFEFFARSELERYGYPVHEEPGILTKTSYLLILPWQFLTWLSHYLIHFIRSRLASIFGLSYNHETGQLGWDS
jgi:hypothetical protein